MPNTFYNLFPEYETMLSMLFSFLVIVLVIQYLISSFTYRKLLQIAKFPNPNKAFIPFANTYYLGALGHTVADNSMSMDELNKQRRKKGIVTIVFTFILPMIFFSVIVIFFISALSNIIYSGMTSETIYPEMFLPLLTNLGFIMVFGIIFTAIIIYFTYKMYRNFCHTALEAISFAIIPYGIYYISQNYPDNIVLTLLSTGVFMLTPLVFALTRKQFSYTNKK